MWMLGCTVDQAATEFNGEDLATLLERLQHDQLGDIGDWVVPVEATPMEGCNPDINDMVLTPVPGHIEGNEINSLCEYEHVMKPPQPFVQFEEYLSCHALIQKLPQSDHTVDLTCEGCSLTTSCILM